MKTKIEKQIENFKQEIKDYRSKFLKRMATRPKGENRFWWTKEIRSECPQLFLGKGRGAVELTVDAHHPDLRSISVWGNLGGQEGILRGNLNFENENTDEIIKMLAICNTAKSVKAIMSKYAFETTPKAKKLEAEIQSCFTI